MFVFRLLFSNYIINVSLIGWFSAQICKFILVFISKNEVNYERLFGAGGMPSSHSAMVCAMTVAVAQVCGLNSPEFALAVIFSAIVMYDAMSVRRAAGEQAKIINKIVDEVEKSGMEFTDKDLKEYLGHTPLEVLCGALLGILITVIYRY